MKKLFLLLLTMILLAGAAEALADLGVNGDYFILRAPDSAKVIWGSVGDEHVMGSVTIWPIPEDENICVMTTCRENEKLPSVENAEQVRDEYMIPLLEMIQESYNGFLSPCRMEKFEVTLSSAPSIQLSKPVFWFNYSQSFRVTEADSTYTIYNKAVIWENENVVCIVRGCARSEEDLKKYCIPIMTTLEDF